MLTGIAHAYDPNHLINSSYTGDCFQAQKSGGATQEIGFTAEGKVDKDAISNFANGEAVGIKILYDQYGTRHYTATEFTAIVYEGTSFNENAEGRLLPDTNDTGYFTTSELIADASTFSLYVRVGQINAVDSIYTGIFAMGSRSDYHMFYGRDADNVGSDRPANEGIGVHKSWVNDTQLPDLTSDGAYRVFDEAEVAGDKIFAVTGATYTADATNDFRFMYASYQWYKSHFGTLLVYSRDTESDHSTITSYINDLYIDTPIPSVTFTDDLDVPIVGADVMWIAEDPFVATDPQWTNAQVVGSNYVTDGQGVATYDPNTDPAVDDTKVYTAVARYLEWDGTKWVPTMGAITAQNNVDLTPPA